MPTGTRRSRLPVPSRFDAVSIGEERGSMNDAELLAFAKRVMDRAWADLPPADRSLLEAIRAEGRNAIACPLGVYTDELRSYDTLNARGYAHSRIQHNTEVYVSGDVHTQTIEGFWSLVKRGMVGTFHKVSRKYLPLYVAEFEWRYNNRDNADIFGAVIARC